MDNIKDVVNRVIGQMSKQEFSADTSIERLINNIFSDQEKKHSKFLGVKEGQVSILVDSSAWLFQMNIKKNKFLLKIQEDKPEVQNISFKIGKVT